MKIEKLLNKNKIDMLDYKPGGMSISVSKPGITICKLDANENQLKPSQLVLDAMKTELSDCYLYPFDKIEELRGEISKLHEVSTDQVIIANGSTSLIFAIADLFFNDNDQIIYSKPTYTTYTLLASRYGITEITTNNKSNASNIPKILSKITDQTKIVVLVNPNNPTGASISIDDLLLYKNNVPTHVITIIDEAYIDFSDGNTTSMIPYILENPNFIVLRTFSKLYALAGLRLGYAVTSPQIQQHLVKYELHNSPSRLACIAGIASLKDTNFIKQSIKNNSEGRTYLENNLIEIGFNVIKSHANFIYFIPNVNSDKLNKYLLENGMIIRPFSNNALRITIGLPYQNKLFIKILKEYIYNWFYFVKW